MSREMKQLSILDWALGSGFPGSGLLGSQAPSQEEEAEAHRTHSPRKGSALEVCYCQTSSSLPWLHWGKLRGLCQVESVFGNQG